MVRSLLCLCWLMTSFANAADQSDQPFTAKFDLKYQPTGQAEAREIHTKVMGKVGEPLRLTLASDEQFFCDIHIAAIPNTAPRQYRVALEINAVDNEGREQMIAAPTLLLLADKPGRVEIGGPNQGLQLDVLLKE